MKRMQIQLTNEQADRLRQLAARRGESIAGLVREALDRHLAEDGHRSRRDQAVSAIGGFRSGRDDIAQDHDRYLADDFSS